MKVLTIPFNYKNPYFPVAGVFVEEQIKAVQQHQVQVAVLNVVAIPLPLLMKKGLRALGYSQKKEDGVLLNQFLFPAIPKLPRVTQWLRVRIQKRIASKLVKRWKPDLCHVHMFPGGDVARWLKQHCNIPYVVTEHLSGFSEARYNQVQLNTAKSCYQGALARIAVSQHLSKTLQNLFDIPFNVIPNCVDTAFFLPKSERDDNKITKLITIGRMVAVKNQLGLLNAFAEADLPKNVTLTIVGDGPLRADIVAKIASLNLRNRVYLMGQLDKAGIKQALESHDAFVLSSHYETFGVVLIEAMSMGLPVISTPCLGASEIVTSKAVGHICTHTDDLANDLANFVEQSFNASFIREYAEQNFSYGHVAQNLLSVYSTAISTNASSVEREVASNE